MSYRKYVTVMMATGTRRWLALLAVAMSMLVVGLDPTVLPRRARGGAAGGREPVPAGSGETSLERAELGI